MFEGPHNEEQKIAELQAILREKIRATSDDDLELYDGRKTRFVREIIQRFPEAIETKLYHVLIGSSKRPEMFDVPGGLIERFIREEL